MEGEPGTLPSARDGVLYLEVSVFEFRPMMLYKLNNRLFDWKVLKAIFDHEQECGSILAFAEHPTSWGWATRNEIAKRMGYGRCSKVLSVKIRDSFLWLEEHGLLKHADVNVPGKKYGATRFLIAFLVFRAVSQIRAVVSKESKDTSRNDALISGEKPCHKMSLTEMFQSRTLLPT